MAELHVQRKRNNYSWVWLLLVILIIGAAVYWYMNHDKETGEVSPPNAVGTSTDTSRKTRHRGTLAGTGSSGDGHEISWRRVDFNDPGTVVLNG